MNNTILDFDSLASAYDAWFDGEGKLIFAIEVKAFQEILPLLPKPWLEVGVGSGRFAQALGIESEEARSNRVSGQRGGTVLR